MTQKQMWVKSAVAGVSLSIATMLHTTPSSAQNFDWSGFYLGAHTDYAFSKGIDVATANKLKNKSFDLGLHTGYNIQWDSLILGVEADLNALSFAKKKRRAGAISQAYFSPAMTARGRIGFAIDRALLFGTAGLSLGVGSLKGGGRKSGKLHSGFVVGGGMEYAINENWLMRGQYLYHNYGKAESYKLNPARKVKYNAAHSLSLGVSYKF